MPVDRSALGSRYVLDRQIGKGAMGVVWRGRDRESGTVYAIKLLRPDLLGDPVLVGRFVRERTALMAVRHPKTVAVHDMVVEGDRLALIMEFVSGEDLRAYRLRRGGSLPPAEAAWLLAQTCEALAATHAAGIVHRDLKPANVLLDGTRPNAPVRLADFGIARILDEASVTSAGTILGTPSYLSPEVMEGEQPGPACDIYAAGITLYELIAGSVPFRGSPAAVFQQHLNARPRPDPRIPRELWAIITRCLAKTPAERPSAAALVGSLAEAVGDPRSHRYAAPHPPAPGGPGPHQPWPERGAGSVQESGPGSTPNEGPRGVPGWSPTSPTGTETAGLPESSLPQADPPRGLGAAPRPTPPGPVPTLDLSAQRATPYRTALSSRRRWPILVGVPAAVVLLAAIGVTAVLLPSGHPRHRPTAVTSTPARRTNPVTSAPSSSVGWQCGPEMTLGRPAHTLRACVETDGTHLYLKGYLSPVPKHVNEKIILVVKDPGQQDAARYTSPECKARKCTFRVTAKVGRGTYSCLPQWAYLDKYQATGRESPFVTF